MSDGNVTVIEFVARLTDRTAAGAASATENVGKMEKALQKAQREIDKINKMSKIEMTAYLIDKASKGISAVVSKGREIAGKVWSVTLGVIDKVTAPIRGIISKIGDLIGITGIAAAALGGLSIKNALQASAASARYLTQFNTVARNVGIDQAGQSDILNYAGTLQNQTMYDAGSMTAGAAEISTYLSDPAAIKQMMGTLTDYAAGMSGGVELSAEQMVDYATQLGKALNAEDAAFDGLKKKGFTVSDAQEKILKSSLTSDLEKSAALTEIIAQSWNGLAREFASTPTGKIVKLKNAFTDIQESMGKKLEPSTGKFLSMLEKKMPAVSNLLSRGAEALGGLFEKFIPSIERGIDWAIGGIERLSDKLSRLADTPEFQGANLFGKARILWDEIIAKPFSEWWEGTGRAWMREKAGEFGSALGSGLTKGLLALLGIGDGDALSDGISVGQSFVRGFLDNFDGQKVGRAFKNAIQSFLENNPIIANVIVGIAAVKGLDAALKVIQGGSNLAKLFGGGAASGAGGSGGLGMAVSGLGGALVSVVGAALAAAGVVSAINDFVKANETYNDNLEERISGSVKLGMVGAGAAIGTLIAPGIGTAVGAGIGGLLALITGGEIGHTAAGWIDGTGKFEEAAKNLSKVTDEYTNARDLAKETAGYVNDWMEANKELSQWSSAGGGAESQIADAREKQSSAIKGLMEIYPGLISDYDLENGKLEEKLELINQIAEAEKQKKLTRLKETVAEKEKDFSEIEPKVQESRGIMSEWQRQIDERYALLPEIMTLKADYAMAALTESSGILSDTEIQNMYDALWERVEAVNNALGWNFSGAAYAGEGAENNLWEEINRLNDSVAKEQQSIDKWISQYGELSLRKSSSKTL